MNECNFATKFVQKQKVLAGIKFLLALLLLGLSIFYFKNPEAVVYKSICIALSLIFLQIYESIFLNNTDLLWYIDKKYLNKNIEQEVKDFFNFHD